ncbi:MAG: sialate O-acetylesterase [Planctomycetota bacterium]|nr:sialate O-acetylesterase [Planctomycetota bacterium]
MFSNLSQRAMAVMVVTILASSARAEVKLAGVFGEHMVLQRGVKVPVWGTAGAGEKVAVAFNGQSVSAAADEKGAWKVVLESMEAGGPFELTVEGANKLTVPDVLVGDVWVASGQSNMEWVVQNSNNAPEELAAADFPRIRHFKVKRAVAGEPAADGQGAWVVCSPKTAGGFSAVAYYFARDLHRQLNVPIGLLNTSWGGTPAQAWTRREALAADEALKGYLDAYDKAMEGYDERKKKHDEQVEAWKKQVEEAKAKGEKPPRQPNPPMGPDNPHRPSGLWNGMVAPLLPYAIKGAIWYQGESNSGDYARYEKLFTTMISDWRAQWGQGDFPFLFVQLANFMARAEQPTDDNWPRLRETQLNTLKLPNTGMAVIIDIGDEKDIHPRNKQDVGKRLALAARKLAYGEDLVYSGPVYEKMDVAGGKATLHFKHVGGGLAAQGGEPLKGFAVCGEDKEFVWADAKIEGETVVVSSEKVAAPVAVRYAWANSPECNLYNKEGLPATPFRTDDWPKAAPPPKPAQKTAAPPAEKTAKTGEQAPVKPPAPPGE